MDRREFLKNSSKAIYSALGIAIFKARDNPHVKDNLDFVPGMEMIEKTGEEYITISGTVRGLDTAAYDIGDYCPFGLVTRSHATQGSVFISPDAIMES